MKRILLFLSLLFVALSQNFLSAQPDSAKTPSRGDEADIRAVIAAQSEAWNRADIPAFMQSYEDSPDTTFIGLTLRKGFKPIRERYMLNYTTPEQMGKLSFNDLQVRLLPASCGKTEYAVVTGKFHLDRTMHGEAKKDDGIFSLVWHKSAHGWKIILDHTS
jgi:ketosteroid isomerase-like protein